MAIKSSFSLATIFLYFVAIISCKPQSSNIIKNEDQSFEFPEYNGSYFLPFNWNGASEGSNIMNYLGKSNFSQYVKEVKFLGKKNIKDCGEFKAYKVLLEESKPGMFRGDKILLISTFDKKAYWLWFDEIIDLKIEENVNNVTLAGIDKFRSVGNLNILEFRKDTLFVVYETEFPVLRNREDDCIRYEEGTLKVTVKDLNSDGLSDLLFTGTELNYCNENEMIMNSPQKLTKIRKEVYTLRNINGYSWKLVE